MRRITMVCLILAAGLTIAATPADASSPRNLTDFGSLNPAGINAVGDIVLYDDSYDPHVYLWNAATGITDLGFIGGIAGINNDRQIIGRANAHATLWDPVDGETDLGTLGGANSFANDINELGVVASSAETAVPGQTHAFLWDSTDGMLDLGTLGGTNSFALGINDLGQVVGYADSANGSHAFLWDSVNGMTDLVAAGCDCFDVRSINNAGQIVGRGPSPSGPYDYHAIVWDPIHGRTDLGTLPGGCCSAAAAINNAGQVVGQASGAFFSGYHAFIWDPVRGMRDLGTRFATGSSATGVNNSGSQVIGRSGTHGVLWTLPTSTPSVSVGTASVVEGDTGKARTLQFPVTLSEPSTATVSVDYALVADGSASAGSDFVAASGTVTFTRNSRTGLTPTTRFISAKTLPNVAPDGDRTFHVVLSNPTGYYSLGNAIGTGTILDDDPPGPLEVGIGDASGWEGQLGTANTIKVWVTLSQPASSTVTVQATVTTTDATPGVDFKGASKTLTFTAGQYKKAFAIKIFPDLSTEGPEHVSIELTNPTGGLSLGRSIGTVTILDDD
jgi:probable HAF family extracellular repeat protein